MIDPVEAGKGIPTKELVDRLDRLAARLEDEGRYVDALLVVFAIDKLGGEATVWTRVMEGLWRVQEETK